MLKTIVIDPGHGGSDPGAVAPDYHEKNLNLKISKKIVNELLPYQCTVKLTRKSDIYVGLAARAEFANSLNANFFVSVHVNAGGGTGFESFIHWTAPELTGQYQDTVHGRVASYLDSFGIADRGEKRADFAVLRLTKMPAILLENLFIDNNRDISFLTNEPFIAGLSHSIAGGIAQSLKIPLKEDPWDPAWEIAQLQADKLINSPKQPSGYVPWGELATVMNRLREVPPPSDTWNPDGEIELLIQDKILHTRRKASATVLWGEFATVLNRLRKRNVTAETWDPEAEIGALIDDRLLMSPRKPTAGLKWGESATVLNRYRGIGG
ncbi:MAG: N-acetylmuramoyl-L-alanine amidase [Bacillota bacterium]